MEYCCMALTCAYLLYEYFNMELISDLTLGFVRTQTEIAK